MYIYIIYIYIYNQQSVLKSFLRRSNNGLSPLSHTCRFDFYQQRMLKTFSSPDYLQSEDRSIRICHGLCMDI